MKDWTCVFLFACSLLMGCHGCFPEDSWEDKDVGFLIDKLKSWHPDTRSDAVYYLKRKTQERKTQERDKVIAALTHTLLNDTHEKVRSQAAQALANMTPPAAEAVPALREALHLPEKDRGKPFIVPSSFYGPLPQEVEWALESITGAQKAIEAIEESGPPPIESTIPDGASDVDAEFINIHGITLRLPRELPTHGHCHILAPDQRIMWYQWFSTMARDIFVTLKPGADDPKLVNGTVYVLEVYGYYKSTPYLITTFTFTTKP